MDYCVRDYLKTRFRWMISEKRKKDYYMMHYYEHILDGAITALFYASVITDSEFHFLRNLTIRIICGKVR